MFNAYSIAPLSLDGRGVGERVVVSPYLIAASIEVPESETQALVRLPSHFMPVNRTSAGDCHSILENEPAHDCAKHHHVGESACINTDASVNTINTPA